MVMVFRRDLFGANGIVFCTFRVSRLVCRYRALSGDSSVFGLVVAAND